MAATRQSSSCDNRSPNAEGQLAQAAEPASTPTSLAASHSISPTSIEHQLQQQHFAKIPSCEEIIKLHVANRQRGNSLSSNESSTSHSHSHYSRFSSGRTSASHSHSSLASLAGRRHSPSGSSHVSKLYNPLDPLTLLTFTTSFGGEFEAPLASDSTASSKRAISPLLCPLHSLPEHQRAIIDRARCRHCHDTCEESLRNPTMAPMATKDMAVLGDEGIGMEKEAGIVTYVQDAKVTMERRPFVQDEGNDILRQAGVARANIAASYDCPNGTTADHHASRNKDRTVLQQHCDFFDTDNDGVIWPFDTYRGFFDLGFGLVLSLIAVLVIHPGFSYVTLPPGRWLPDLRFRLYTAQIHKAKHGSDSGAYDAEGRFLPQKFEDVFAKHASGDKQGITLPEITNYLKGQRVMFDPFGWTGAALEWLALYYMLWPEDGRIMKEDVRKQFDGSLFYELRDRNRRKLKQGKMNLLTGGTRV